MAQEQKKIGEYLRLLSDKIAPAKLSQKTMEEMGAFSKEVLERNLSADDEIKAFLQRLIDLCDQCTNELNVKISALSGDESEITNALKKIGDIVDEMGRQKRKDVLSIGRFPVSMISGAIVHEVSQKLKDFLNDLSVGSGGNKNEQDLIQRINDIACQETIALTENKIKSMKQQIILDCSRSIEAIEKIMENSTVKESIGRSSIWTTGSSFQESDTMAQTNKGKRDNLIRFIGIAALAAAVFFADKETFNAASDVARAKGSGVFTKMFRTVMGLGGILMIFFPQIRGALRKAKKTDMHSESEDKIISDIKLSLSELLPKIINVEIKTIEETVEKLWDEKIEKQKAQSEKEAEEKMPGAKERQRERKELEDIRSAARSLTNEILTWRK